MDKERVGWGVDRQVRVFCFGAQMEEEVLTDCLHWSHTLLSSEITAIHSQHYFFSTLPLPPTTPLPPACSSYIYIYLFPVPTVASCMEFLSCTAASAVF